MIKESLAKKAKKQLYRAGEENGKSFQRTI